MVTQQSWMFLRSFAELRAIPEEKLREATRKAYLPDYYEKQALRLLAHLGRNAFEEISGEVVAKAMFILTNRKPSNEHRMVAFRLVGLKSARGKVQILLQRHILKR